MKANSRLRHFVFSLGGISLLIAIAFVCARRSSTVEPDSPWYIGENIRHSPSPDFKLSREAAAMKAYKADLEAQQARQ